MQLAQLNIGHAVAPLDDPAMADFAARIDEINALADTSPGFVWRHVGEAGYQDGGDLWGPAHLVNLSVWQSIEALADFTYRTDHKDLIQARRRWFRPMDGPHQVMWWVPHGHRPTLEEAKQRLDQRASGPGPHAFDFAHPYGPDGRPLGRSDAPVPGHPDGSRDRSPGDRAASA